MVAKNMETTCPYCGFDIQPPPQRKRQCPQCNNTVYPKKPCCDRNNAKQLMTEAMADHAEKRWSHHQGIQQIMRELHLFNVQESEVGAQIRLFPGAPPPVIAKNIMAMKLKEFTDPHTLKMAYLTLAIQQRRLENNPLPFLRKVAEYQIRELAESPITAGVRIAVPESDNRTESKCVRLSQRIYTIDEALTEMPMPCKPDCICYWEAVSADEM